MAESLAVKYRPSSFDDVVEQNSVKTILRYQLETNTIQHAYLFVGSAGCGKAQPLYSKVLTPTGYISMGDVKLGQEVITRKGDVACITGIYPQGKRPVYEITLQDRTKIRVADNHLNSVYRYNQHKKAREDYVLTTLELIEFIKSSKYKVRVDTPSVDFGEQKILIDPYLLGALIGDGSLHGNFSFSNSEQDIISTVNRILNVQYDMRLQYQDGCDYAIQYNVNPKHNGSRGDRGKHELVRNYDVLSTLKGQLEHYGLLRKSIDKHIPKAYLINTKEVRMKLLQGLFDTDGYISKEGEPSFSTSSKQLSDDFAFLVRSLGIRDTICKKRPKFTYRGEAREGQVSYIHHLHVPNGLPFFTSEKHSSRYCDRQQPPLRNIVSIEYVGEEKCQCIMVDNEDHTYISDDFIPTHNTTCARIFANEINKGQGTPIEIDAASHNSVDDVRAIIEDSKLQSIDSEYKVYILDECHMLSTQAWNAMLKMIEEPPAKAIYILCTTNPERIPQTILSRVQRYDFQKISTDSIVKRLDYILAKEIEAGNLPTGDHQDLDAVQYIAKLSNGGMRTAISLMDKCLSYSKDLTVENVVSALGVADYSDYTQLAQAMLMNDERGAVSVLESVKNSGKDIKQFVKGFLEFCLDVCKYCTCRDFKYIKIPNTADYTHLLDHWVGCGARFKRYVGVLINLNAELRWETDPFTLTEATILLECAD